MGVSDLQEFSDAYRPVFNVVCPTVCAIGIIANCLNVLVLTRKGMASPTNTLLVSLALADGFSMASLLTFSITSHFLDGSHRGSLIAIRISLYSTILTVLVHSIAIWLAVVLAMFRALIVYFPFRASSLCTISKVNVVSLVISMLLLLIAVPNAAVYKIEKVHVTYSNDDEELRYFINVRSNSLWNTNLILQAVVIKLLPCLMLLLLNLLLIRGIYYSQRHHEQLAASNGQTSGSGSVSTSSTSMLVAVVTLSILTETPQGIILFWYGLDHNVAEIYSSLGDFVDTLTIINSSINFLLYCSMSSKFRTTFATLFKKCIGLSPTVLSVNHDMGATQ